MVLMDKVKDGSTGVQPVFGYGGGGGFGFAGLNFEFMFQVINSDTNNTVQEPFSPPVNPQPLSPSIDDVYFIPAPSQTDSPLFTYSPLTEPPALVSDAQPSGQGVAGLIAAAIQQQVEAPDIDTILAFGSPDISGQNASHAEDMSAIYSAVIEEQSTGANTPVGPIFSASIMPVANTISNFIEQHITAHHLGNGALSFIFEQNLEDGSMTSSVYHLNASGTSSYNAAQQNEASVHSEVDSVSSHPELNAPVPSPIDLHFSHMESDDEGFGELLANNVIINHIENENPVSPGNVNQSDSDDVPNQSSPE